MKNFKSIIRYFVVLVVAIIAVSCGDKAEEPQPVPTTTPRTVLVYMLANNSLGDSGFDSKDLKEMERAAGDLGRSRWVVYHQNKYGDIELKELRPTGWVALKSYSNDIMSTTSQRLSEVIRDTKAMAPANNYGLILWSHGSGWVVDGSEDVNSGKSSDIATFSFGADRDPAGKLSTMNVATLRRVLKGQDFDYIYTDCCNMSTIEVVYELRDVAKYFVGSALELPADGMPYDRNLKYLVAENPDMVKIAQTTFDYYANRDRDGDWCSMAVIKLDEIEELARITKHIYEAVPYYDAKFVPQSLDIWKPYRYYDFAQFVDYLANSTGYRDAWDKQLQKAVLYQACMPKFDKLTIKYHCGLATNILTTSFPESYGYFNTEWYKDVAYKQPMAR